VSPDAALVAAGATPPRAGKKRQRAPLRTMSFFQHLEELRATLIRMLLVGAAAATAGWFVSERLLGLLVPAELGQVHYFNPTEGFMIRFKVSIAVGLLVAMPILLMQVWSFVAPGLFQNEKRFVFPVLLASTLLFYLGLAFAYAFVVPRMVSFFLSFSAATLKPIINVTQYFSFVTKFCLAFGLVFQIPVVIVLLAWLGLVTPRQLLSQWRYGVVIIFIVAAWLTPPDAVSQVMMAIPMVVLYMGAIGLAFVVGRRRQSRRSTETDPDPDVDHEAVSP